MIVVKVAALGQGSLHCLKAILGNRRVVEIDESQCLHGTDQRNGAFGDVGVVEAEVFEIRQLLE